MHTDESDMTTRYSIFRSSWLQRVPVFPTFKPGDFVTLHPSHRTLNEGKCLDSGGAGIVVSTGPIRNGIQRNIEVVSLTTTEFQTISQASESPDEDSAMDSWEGNWHQLCGSGTQRSLYPNIALIPALRSLTFLPSDLNELTNILRRNFSDSTLDLGGLLKKFGSGVSCICWCISPSKFTYL